MNDPRAKFFRTYFDMWVVVSALMLTGIGLLSVYSATHESNMSSNFTHQVTAAVLGVVLMIVLTFMSNRFLSFVAYPAYGMSILFLIAVLLIGKTSYGSKSWIVLAGFSFQPSEFAKLATVLALAKFFSGPTRDMRRGGDLGIALGIVCLPVVLIAFQPDVGTAIVFFAVLGGMLLWGGGDVFMLLAFIAPPVIAITAFFGLIPAGIVTVLAILMFLAFRRRVFVTALTVGLCVLAMFSTKVVFEHLKPHQQKRIEVFLNPNNDPLGAGYNVLQAQMAVGSGGVFGKGFLQGTQTQLRYIPKQWTDFIYCVPTEEFGFVGGGMVIVLFTILCWRGVWIAFQTRQQFASAAAIGVVALILFHAVFNIGMTVGVFPVMGIPLPFLSYGGTFLLVDLAAVGVLLNIYRTRFEY